MTTTEVSSRELRADVSAVLRRVEEGEELTVTVGGRPVARLTPLRRRPRTIPTATLLAALDRVSADPELAHELADQLPHTTD